MQIRTNLRRLKWRLARVAGERILNYQNRGIINLIDVGALGWMPVPWSRLRNAAKIHHLLRFEPQEQASNNPNVTTVNMALWEENGSRDFYVFANQAGGASLFQQNYDYVRENYATLRLRGSAHKAETWFERSAVKNITQIECRTLDDVLADLQQLFSYHFLKVDAQGAEYQILKGAEHFLRTSCLGLQLELFEFPIMKGIMLLPDVVAYLDEFGFELREQTPTESTFAAAYDCLFLKKNHDNGITKEIKDIYGISD